MATLNVTHTESLTLNGQEQGSTNTLAITGINNVYKRIVTVPTSEIVLASFGTAVAAGTFNEANVRYVRITNRDTTNHLYLVLKNEYSNECCLKLDKGQTFVYNADLASGVIDTMLANQVALGFAETTGDCVAGNNNVTSITANGAITGGDSTSGYRATAHTMVTRNATTGAETASNATGSTANDQVYKSGFGDLSEITAEADTASCDIELFIATV